MAKTTRGREHKHQAAAKRPGALKGLPSNVLRTFCGFHDVFLNHIWLGLSCFNTSAYVLRTL
eukprot:5660249-Pyramimonas_sp.AAC.1